MKAGLLENIGFDPVVHHRKKAIHHEEALRALEDRPYSAGDWFSCMYHSVCKWIHEKQIKAYETIYG